MERSSASGYWVSVENIKEVIKELVHYSCIEASMEQVVTTQILLKQEYIERNK